MVGLSSPAAPRVVESIRSVVQAGWYDQALGTTARGSVVIGSRRTIARETAIEGIGLHLGKECRLSFRPAASGSGITFIRTDRGGKRFPATADVAVLAERRTQLGEGEDALHTVEHVLAAVSGAFIDDVDIELDGPEPPIADGSAEPFLAALLRAGVALNAGKADYLTIRAPFVHKDGDS